MICFSLLCSKDHSFDSWFAKSQDFDALVLGAHLCCPICGDSAIRKGLMAPALSNSAAPERANSAAAAPPSLAPKSKAELAVNQMRAHLEANSDYVGMNFAAEARAMHEGETPARPIYGEAKVEDARALLQDGIPVAPLPFLPRAKVN
ncbi:MAG: DUF1178 family protein [Cypionkella sp.]|nr:DUF1178 family protein [Cypionkella sp.]